MCVWIFCLCINQHRVVEQHDNQLATTPKGKRAPKVNFFDEFGQRVAGIGHMLAMMTPWHNPGYLDRIWCVFELYSAHCNSKCQSTISMPPKENESLEKELFGEEGRGVDALYEASLDSDRTAILKIVKSRPGYEALNHAVNDLLRSWVENSIGALIDKYELNAENGTESDKLKFATLCNKVSCIMNANAEYDIALSIAKKAHSCLDDLRTTTEKIDARRKEELASTYTNYGSVLSPKDL